MKLFIFICMVLIEGSLWFIIVIIEVNFLFLFFVNRVIRILFIIIVEYLLIFIIIFESCERDGFDSEWWMIFKICFLEKLFLL